MFDRNALEKVTIPVQLWRSERGGDELVPDAVIALAATISEAARISCRCEIDAFFIFGTLLARGNCGPPGVVHRPAGLRQNGLS